MQAYGSLAFKDNLEVGEVVLDRGSTSCVWISAFKLPVKEADPKLAMGPSGRGFSDNVYLPVWFLKDQLQKGLEWSWATSSSFLGPTLVF